MTSERSDNHFLFADFEPENGQAEPLIHTDATRKLGDSVFDPCSIRGSDLPFPNVTQPDSRLTVRQVIASYLELGCGRYAPRALVERRRVWMQLCDDLVDYPAIGMSRLGDRPVAHCRQIDLLKWLAAHPEWKSDWTRRGVVNAVERPFNWAAASRLIPANPFLGVSHPEGDPRRPISDEEFARLLRATTPIFRRVIIFMASTGCRTDEMARLVWPWIDWQRGCIIIPAAHHKTGRKTKKPRVIPLTACAMKLLLWIRRRAEPRMKHGINTDAAASDPCFIRVPSVANSSFPLTGHVFLTTRGTPWNRCNLSLRMRRLRTVAQVPDDCYLYGCRHRFGTNWIKAGGSLKQLSQAMGHTSTAITERMYVDIAGEIDLLRQGAEAATRRRKIK